MGYVVDFLIDWGMEGVKNGIKSWNENRKLRHKMEEYFTHQEKINELSSLAEEIDFEGLAQMLKEELPKELERYLFGSLEERKNAREIILSRVSEYEISSNGRAKVFVQDTLGIMYEFFRSNIKKENQLIANRIVEELSTVFHEELENNLKKKGSREIALTKEKTSLRDVLSDALNRMFDRADHYSLPLDPVEKSLSSDIFEESRHFRYHSTENQTALMQKLKAMEGNLEWGKPVYPLLMTGEGGIGKTITMLQTARQLLEEGKYVIYVPLRGLRDNISLEQFILNSIFRNDTEMFEKLWNTGAKQMEKTVNYFLLDGFNEVQRNLKSGLVLEIRDLAAQGNIVVVSSRRTFEEENCMESHYQRLCMERLPWDKVVSYLNSKKIPIPDEKKMSEILGIPLMLIIYTRVCSMEKQNILGDPSCRWRSDLSSPGNLLWDYIQCQIFAAKKILREAKYEEHPRYCSMDFVVAAEFIAPYLASRMNGIGLYDVKLSEVRQWTDEGLRLMQTCTVYQNRRDDIQLIEEEDQVYDLPSAAKILQLLKGQINLFCIEDSNRLTFVHQEFQDTLHYIYIEESFQTSGDAFYAGAVTDTRLPYDVITRVSEMLPREKIQQIWDSFCEKRNGRSLEFVIQPGEYGIANLVEIFKRIYENNLSGLDFSELDLSRTVLTGTILSEKNRKACFKNAVISAATFSSQGHSAAVSSVAFDHTGGKFVSASYDKTLLIWNTSHEEEPVKLDGHRHYVRCVAWSPDGLTIISGGDDKELFVWDVPTWINTNGEKKKLPLDFHEGWIYSAAWSASGEEFASGDSRGILCIWKYNYGEKPVLERKIYQAHRGSIQCIAWSPAEDAIFASGSGDGQLKLWNYQKEVFCTEDFHGGVAALAWSPDGQMLAVGAGREISLWKICGEDLDFHLKKTDRWEILGEAVSGLVWTDDFLAYGTGREIRILSLEHIWKLTDDGHYFWNPGEYCETVSLTGHKSLIQCIAWSSLDQKLLTGSDDSSIRIWKARNPLWHKDWNCIRAIEGASLPVRCVVWSEDSKNIAAGYDDNVLRQWNIEQETCCGVFRGHENRIKCVDWKGNYLVSGSNDNSLRIWESQDYGQIDTVGGQKNSCLRIKKCGGAVNCVKWFSDEHKVISGSDDGSLLIWNWVTGEELRLEGHENRVYGVDLSPDEKIAASGSNDRTIRFWNTQTGREIEKMRIVPDKDRGHQEPIRAVVWSPLPGFPCLVSASNDQTLICWEKTENGRWKKRMQMTGHEDFVYCLAWQPEGRYLVSGSTDNTLWIWDVRSGKPLYHLTEHTNYAHGVAWSPDGNYIASASCDGKVIIWDVRNLPEKAPVPIHTFEAMNAVNLIGCDFTGARFETEELEKRVKMNGGKFGG